MNNTFQYVLLAAFLFCYQNPADGETNSPLSQQSGIVLSEFVYDSAPFPSCHASTIEETKDGLIAAWFGGTHERHTDVGIWQSRLINRKWSVPVEVANGIVPGDQRYPTWNPVLFQPNSGPLMLFYKVGPTPRDWWGMVKRSADGGQSWSSARRLPHGILGPIKNKPIQLASGDILSPSSSEHDGWRVHFERSTDNGKTWQTTQPANDGKKINAIQPSLLVHGTRRLQALGRTKSSRVFQIWSEDAGRTWSEMKLTSLPNPNAGTDAVTLADGRHLIVYNHNPNNRGRSPLNVAISNNGIDWLAALVLEDTPSQEFSYPAVIQTSDRLVHVTYTWKRERIRHVVIDPAELKLAPINNGRWPGAGGEK